MCSGSEAGSCLRLIDFVYHSTLGLKVRNKKEKDGDQKTDVDVLSGLLDFEHGVAPRPSIYKNSRP